MAMKGIGMDNTWLNENQEDINFYIGAKDLILVERSRQLKIFLDLLDFYFIKKEALTLLDFGCGDGVITKLIMSKYPDNDFYLLDGSETMLKKAKELLPSSSTHFLHATFEDFTNNNEDENKFDVIFSSMAIHHLEHLEKLRLYSTFHALLKNNGLFVNMDVVLPASRRTEEFQFKLWTDWINEKSPCINADLEKGRHDAIPSIYKNKSENKPSSLKSQLAMLEDTGFNDVECYYKYGIFALFGGIK